MFDVAVCIHAIGCDRACGSLDALGYLCPVTVCRMDVGEGLSNAVRIARVLYFRLDFGLFRSISIVIDFFVTGIMGGSMAVAIFVIEVIIVIVVVIR